MNLKEGDLVIGHFLVKMGSKEFLGVIKKIDNQELYQVEWMGTEQAQQRITQWYDRTNIETLRNNYEKQYGRTQSR